MNALLRPAALVVGWVVLATLTTATAAAQFGPPSTVFGSINDEAGPVAEGLKVEAYIGNAECSDGHGRTEMTGDGAARVTVYAVDVVSREQRPGCGFAGAEVRIKIGDRFAPGTTRWSGAGFVRFDITFGNVTPKPIPTFTPTSTGPRSPTVPGATATPTAPGAATSTPGGDASPSATGSVSPTISGGGGVTSSTPGPGVDSGEEEDGGGMPIWAVVLLVLGGIAAAGGGIGYFIARSHAGEGDDIAAPGPP